MTWVYKFFQCLIFPFIKIYNRTRVKGRRNIPREGGVILASNHSSYCDPLILGTSIWRPLHYLAKAELFNTRLKRFLFTAIGQIKVERGKGDREALLNAINALEQGKTVVFFPEGTTYAGQSLGKGHTGVARVALEARVPVVPVSLLNTWKIFPRGKIIPRPRKAKVIFGAPLRFDKHYGKGDDREIVREITTEIMEKIAALLGKKYKY